MTTYPFTATVHEVTDSGILPVVPEEKVTFMAGTAVGAGRSAAIFYDGAVGQSGQTVTFKRADRTLMVGFKLTPDRGW